MEKKRFSKDAEMFIKFYEEYIVVIKELTATYTKHQIYLDSGSEITGEWLETYCKLMYCIKIMQKGKDMFKRFTEGYQMPESRNVLVYDIIDEDRLTAKRQIEKLIKEHKEGKDNK